ncbi:unnamed protein product [Ostreobium quekettii]|uniref:Patatin n=1 Tax=Ostreobium quekettii TaxID=121088 RepID=A0A8S1J7I3_9CHLO|nr:unnamed protein product [Ostreobium quekettii]
MRPLASSRRLAGQARRPTATEGSAPSGVARLGWGTDSRRRVEEAMLNGDEEAPPPLKLAFGGGGIYFWWELGCIQWLSEHYDLRKTLMVGASGGALAATLAATGVDSEAALESAHRLGKQYGIWERPLGLMGVWGQIVREWLEELLPENAGELCRDRVEVLVTKLPFLELASISDFTSKADLIDANIASVHVPFFMDGQFSTLTRGEWCIDGSFQDFITSSNSDLLTCGGNTVLFDYLQDSYLASERADFMSLKEYDEVKKLMDLGYRHAQRLYDGGEFDRFDSSMCRQGWRWRLWPQWSFGS